MNDAIDDKRTRYFLPPDYEAGGENITLNTGADTAYWDQKRIQARKSYLFQLPVYDYASEVVSENSIPSLIDVGCGAGYKLADLHSRHPELAITGIDQPDAIQFCQNYYNFGQWLSDNFDEPQLSTDIRTELVLCCDVIEHVLYPDTLLAYLKARMMPGGWLIISTPDRVARYGTGMRQSGHPAHVREWAFNEFAEFLADQDFEALEHFHQWPVKPGLSKVFAREFLNQLRNGTKLRYNQIALLKRKD